MKYVDIGTMGFMNILAVTMVASDDLPPLWNFRTDIICELSKIAIANRIGLKVRIVLCVICFMWHTVDKLLNSVLFETEKPKNKGIFDALMECAYSPAAFIIAQ